jgi:hypothetical protein
MKPKSSLPHSQEPATYSYPEPDRSSRCRPSHFTEIRFSIILPFTPQKVQNAVICFGTELRSFDRLQHSCVIWEYLRWYLQGVPEGLLAPLNVITILLL